MTQPRLTTPVIAILKALLEASDEEPAWGLSLCRDTDLGPGTVYVIIERLVTIGWLTHIEETGEHPARPPRRYVRLTDHGRVEAQAALKARADRTQRWA